jgi:alpha-glucosidase (family GH31 glycosyl hydrolase)
MRRGFVFNHTEIGNVDFSQSQDCFGVLMWHTPQMKMHVMSGRTMKNVVTGITKIVGRMKKLPAWTQKGAILGLQGGQDKVTKDYAFLKK